MSFLGDMKEFRKADAKVERLLKRVAPEQRSRWTKENVVKYEQALAEAKDPSRSSRVWDTWSTLTISLERDLESYRLDHPPKPRAPRGSKKKARQALQAAIREAKVDAWERAAGFRPAPKPVEPDERQLPLPVTPQVLDAQADVMRAQAEVLEAQAEAVSTAKKRSRTKRKPATKKRAKKVASVSCHTAAVALGKCSAAKRKKKKKPKASKKRATAWYIY